MKAKMVLILFPILLILGCESAHEDITENPPPALTGGDEKPTEDPKKNQPDSNNEDSVQTDEGNDENDADEDQSAEEPQLAIPDFNAISQKFQDSGCMSCHKDQSWTGIDLDTYSDIIQQKIVLPGDAKNSKLIIALESGSMPMGGPKLDQMLIDNIKEWIDAGAPQ